MNRRLARTTGLALIIAGATVLLAFTPVTRGQSPAGTPYEVWAIDQADLGRGGTRLYIHDGQRLEAGHRLLCNVPAVSKVWLKVPP